jgi:hypothetical protein
MPDSSKLAATAPFFVQPIRWAAVLSVSSYYRVACRIRAWGRLPRRRGPTLVVANHQHEIESPLIVADLAFGSFAWRFPIFTVSSRRMWEPGFFATRIPWLRPLLRTVNLGWLFAGVGMQPIENELHSRPFVSLAYMLTRRYGNAPVVDVFREKALERLPSEVSMLSDLLKPQNFVAGREIVTLSELNEPFRSEALKATRDDLEADLTHFEELQRAGATIFITPEGFYTGDGKMRRLRGVLSRLQPLASIYIAGISYDPFVGRRLSLLYRVVPSIDGIPLDVQLKARRPVTTSALLGTWLATVTTPFTADDAGDAVKRQLADLPEMLFVEPELHREPDRMTQRATDRLVQLGTLRRNGNYFEVTDQRTNKQFPYTTDIIAYQRNYHEETLDGAARFASAMSERGAEYACS